MLNTYKHTTIIFSFLALGLISCSEEKKDSHWELAEPHLVKAQPDIKGAIKKSLITAGVSEADMSDKLVFSNIQGSQVQLKTVCTNKPYSITNNQIIPARLQYSIAQLLPQKAIQKLLKANKVSCSFNFIVSKNDTSHRFSFGPMIVTNVGLSNQGNILFENRRVASKKMPEMDYDNFHRVDYSMTQHSSQVKLLCQRSTLFYSGPSAGTVNLVHFSPERGDEASLLSSQQKCIFGSYNGSFLESYSQPMVFNFGQPQLIQIAEESPRPTSEQIRKAQIPQASVYLQNPFETPLYFRVPKKYIVKYMAEYNQYIYSQIKEGELIITPPRELLITETAKYSFYELPAKTDVKLSIVLNTLSPCFLSSLALERSAIRPVTPLKFRVFEQLGGIEVLDVDQTPIGTHLKTADWHSEKQTQEYHALSFGQSCH